MSTCFLIGLVLLVIFIRHTRRKNRRNTAQVTFTQPPVPPRIPIQTGSSVQQASVNPAGIPRPLPRRRASMPMTIAGGLGPRGIRPEQFPACPFDKQRNQIGAAQKIFWNAAENCYYCSHGHRFKSNGKIIC